VKIIAVGSPKGGVGKTTTAVTLAVIAAQAGLDVLLVDGDANASTMDWAGSAGDEIPLDVYAASDPRELAKLRDADEYDLMVVDLPGARAGAFEAILAGDGGRPVPDLLLVPTTHEILDLRPVMRVVRDELFPLDLPHLIVMTKVPTAALPQARRQRALVLDASAGHQFAETIIRDYSIYNEAVENGMTVLDIPGRRLSARKAEADYRALASEAFTAVDLTLPTTEEADRG
jgi:chromosome partitioning protein